MPSVALSSPPSRAHRLNHPLQYRLPSGITIFAEQMPVEAVTLDVWARVGSAMETDEINGMAHFLEHMVFKGTKSLQSGEFERLVEERGAVMNAATSQDYTHYYLTCAPQDFATLAPLQLDIALNPEIPEGAFDAERQVVLEEIRRSEDDPRRRIYQRTIQATFEQLPYRRPVLGPVAVIEGLSAAQMRQFYQTWYRPENLTLTAVGNLPAQQMIDTLVRHLPRHLTQSQPQPKNAAATARLGLVPEAAFGDRHYHSWSDPSLQQARLSLSWRVPGLRYLSETYALDVVASILSHGRTSRLVRDLREVRSLVTSISASNSSYWAQGVFSVSARLAPEHVETVEAAIAAHIEQLHHEPVTAVELNRVRTQVANRFVFGNERPSDRAGLYGYYNTLIGDLEPAFRYPERIQALSDEDIQAAVERYLSPEAYSVVVVNPQT